MSERTPEPQISHNPGKSRYELRLDGKLVGVANYFRQTRRVVITHTGIDPPYRRRGLAAQLIEFALRDIGDEGLEVEPACWYVAQYIQRNPEFRRLLGEEPRGAVA